MPVPFFARRSDARLAEMRAGVRGKVVAITGGARGIGFEIAGQVLDAGGHVALGDVDVDAVDKAAADLGVTGLPLDVTDAESIETFLDQVEERVGPIDVLINNAGIMPVGEFLGFDDALIRRTVDVDLIGVLLGTRAGARRMAARGHGQIINIASVAGRLAAPGLAVYNGVKSAVIEFSETVDAELAPRGVRVSTVLPSFTRTGLIAGLQTSPLVRIADTDTVARGVVATIAAPRVRVTAPRSFAWVDANPALPVGLKRRLARWTGVDSVFLTADSAARAEYNARIGQD